MPLTDVERQKLITRLTQSKRTSVDGLTTENHSLSEIIEAIKFADACDVVADPSKTPFRINVFRSPGGVYGIGRK